MLFRLRRKKKIESPEEVKETVQRELQGSSYIQHEVRRQLDRIEADKQLKKKWLALPRRTRAKLIERMLAKGEQHGKR